MKLKYLLFSFGIVLVSFSTIAADVKLGAAVWKTIEIENKTIKLAKINGMGNVVITLSNDNEVSLWDPFSGRLIKNQKSFEKKIIEIEFASAYNILLTFKDHTTQRYNPFERPKIINFEYDVEVRVKDGKAQVVVPVPSELTISNTEKNSAYAGVYYAQAIELYQKLLPKFISSGQEQSYTNWIAYWKDKGASIVANVPEEKICFDNLSEPGRFYIKTLIKDHP